MENGTKIKFANKLRAYKKDGKLVFIAKITLPFTESENKALENEFNGFYRALEGEIFSSLDKYCEGLESTEKRGSFSLLSTEKSDNASVIFVKRQWKIVYPTGVVKLGEEDDIFDFKTGFFVKRKKSKQKVKPRHRAST